MTGSFGADGVDRLDAATRRALDELGPAGFSVGVVAGAALAWSRGYGFADMEGGRPQAPELRQRIGSITKTEKVRLRHLLTHTSGIGEVAMPEDVRATTESLWSERPDDDVLGLFPCGVTLEIPLVGRLLAATLGAAPPAPVQRAAPADLLARAPGVYEALPGELTNFRVKAAVGRLQIKAAGDGLSLHARRGPWKAGPRLVRADGVPGWA